ncbi:hypothetical protein [Pedobacter cryoconitis]|uniref:hypothetical protein n=1 Tax=Pedobacter cryoconitis TaxID=188932 RepID=UPI0016221B66|nr:hypothetical protein [Pedobacter cryoconitis]MBB5645815.1 hypothetical protein [Pedobacter cryoconitis]
MKQKITNPNKNFELVTEEKSCDHVESNSAEEIEALNLFLLAYPFMPMIDLTLVFNELRKMVKNWFLNKKEHTNH